MTGTDSMMGMWIAMMVAMMLPSLVPMLWRYRQGVWRAAIAGATYVLLWTMIAVATYPLSIALAAIKTRQPIAAGVIVVIAGALQFTRSKAERPEHHGSAWRHGLALGLHSARCCANLMVIMMVYGAMDLPAMAVITALITADQLRACPRNDRAHARRPTARLTCPPGPCQ